MCRIASVVLCLSLVAAGLCEAQVPGFGLSKQEKLERVGTNHWKLTGSVEIERDDLKFYAEEIEFFTDRDLLIARGNVVFATASNRIAADRVEFNTKTRTGTFVNAAGTASIVGRADPSMFGSQEPEVYFYGDTIAKLGPQKYRITNGAFTSCVQPTPRWEVTSGTVILNLDHYALLTNSIFRVKGVPVFYLPVFYYPMEKDDRATGFLLPTYGTSTIRGHSISNAFFWAINRSQDATLFHDWFSKTGQGLGGEYRFVREGGSGSGRTYFLNEHETKTVSPGGVTTVQPGRRSYQFQGGASQAFGPRVTVRGRADYFSNITVQQTYHTNILQASQRQRTYGVNATGGWGPYSVSGTFERNETFFGETESTVHGGAPRISFNQGDRPLPLGIPMYFTMTGEYATLIRISQSGEQETDTGLTRVHISPLVRIPFTRWPFLTFNSSVAWFGTYWTESKDVAGTRVPLAISRRYFDFTTQITGPVFARIFNTPTSGYAEKFKHVIEPSVSLRRTTAIDHADRIVELEGIDSIVGGATSITYALANRIYAKRKEAGATAASSREIVNVTMSQSYYTDARSSQVDAQIRSSFSGTPPSHLSPVSIAVRASPTNELYGTLRAEYDTQFMALRTIGADGTFAYGGYFQTTAGWSQRRHVPGLSGFDDPRQREHFLNQVTTIRTRGNRLGGVYSFNYDLGGRDFIQQRVTGYYSAQCCGLAVEYQTFNFKRLGITVPVPNDRRFNLSFTLAGIGTFANFFGALGGGPGR